MAKRIELWDISKLRPYQKNPRTHSPDQIGQLAASIAEFGFTNPVLVDSDQGIIAGHGRLEAAKTLGLKQVPVVVLDHLSEDQRRAYIIADNKLALNAGWDSALLAEEMDALRAADFDLSLTGFSDAELAALEASVAALDSASGEQAEGSTSSLGGEVGGEQETRKLADRFLVPPFSVLDQRQGYWKERKRQWLSLGIKSEVGRGANLLGMSETVLEPDPEKRKVKALAGTPSNPEMIRGYYTKIAKGMTREEVIAEHQASGSTMTTGTSIFDPVLCELAYRWFSPEGGTVLDPFAGGSVRGIVASKLGRQYIGFELREEQVAANRQQGAEICSEPLPIWHCADSRHIAEIAKGVQADLVFSCPPYADLEVYSEDPRDLSTLDYEAFRDSYREIIAGAVSLLKEDRFACFVVTEVREKGGGGFYRNFVKDTIEAFEDAGAAFYNEAILVNSVGTLALRVGRIFPASRKLGRTHQNVLVFCKGDPMKATKACGEISLEGLEELEQRLEAEAQQPQGESTDYGEKVELGDIGGEI